MADFGFSEHHQNEVINYMRFARSKRLLRLKTIDSCFQELKDSRLVEETFTVDEVSDMLDGLQVVVHGEVEMELINTAHTNVLLLRQLFSQAEKFYLKLQTDISELESRELLEQVAVFEKTDFKSIIKIMLGLPHHDVVTGLVRYGHQVKSPFTFARFDVEPLETATVQPMVHSSFTLTVKEHEVRCTLRAINLRKAAGPDGIPGHVLKDCTDQLAGVFTRIFNQSLSQSTVPPCLKSSTIIPLPKKPHISSLNEYRPVALTPVVMKCFEKLVRGHIMSLLPQSFDPHQFAYRSNREAQLAYYVLDPEEVIDSETHSSRRRLCCECGKSSINTTAESHYWTYCLGDNERAQVPTRAALSCGNDVVLLAPSSLDLQHALGRFAAECEAAGMRVSTSKSEAMVLDRKKVACTLQVGGEVLPQVEEFKYLGVLFTSEGRMDREIERRIGAATAVMQSMYRSVVVKKVSLDLPVNLRSYSHLWS
ncbi:hypothetical protein QTP70_003260 [Hemibagrus guttatus]|uniref:Leucine zipper transcription factor-like protein 1 n=1 Tax=Hemibagrus guttatus TaxID=175788 RepID=A0AAE0URF6_9TELE|nr:hypothetical protein QTP70_003260 [Hemibagrus guttatus]